MRIFLALAIMVFALAMPCAATAADSSSIDRKYEAAKAAELEAVKLQLASGSGTAAIVELTEAESTLRRLRDAKAPDQRRMIAAELEAALIRLRLEANSAAMRK